MADELKDRIRARRAARMASQPAPTEAPQGFAPVPATAAPPAAKEKPGVAGSFFRGLGQGAMFGFQDEIVGGVRALTEPVRARLAGVDPSFIPSAGEAYRESRDDYRGVLAEDFEENPWATGGGMVAGGLAVPMGAGLKAATLGGKVLQGAGIGAASGALQGVGDAPEMGDIPGSALKGAAIGGVVGGALPAAVAGAGAVRRAAPKARDAIVRGADKVVDLAEKNPLVRAGAAVGSGGASEGVVGAAKMAQKLRRAPKAPAVEPFPMPSAADEDALAAAIRNAAGADDAARATQQIDPGQMVSEAPIASPVPEVTKQTRFPPIPGERIPAQQVDDEIEQALKLLQKPESEADRLAVSSFKQKFSGPGTLVPREQIPDLPSVAGTPPPLNVKTGSMRAPKAGPKGLEFPEPVPGPESVRPMVGKPDPLEAARSAAGGPDDLAATRRVNAPRSPALDLPPLDEPTTGQIRGERFQRPPEVWEGWNAAVHDPDWTPPPGYEDIDPAQLSPTFQGGRMRDWWEVGASTKMGARNSFNQSVMDPEATQEIRPGALEILRSISKRGSGPDVLPDAPPKAPKAAPIRAPNAPPSVNERAFLVEDFKGAHELKDWNAIGTSLQKAKMLGADRATVQQAAKEAGWPPEVMRWAGLLDEAPAPAAPKVAPAQKKTAAREPWQMTRAELSKHWGGGGKSGVPWEGEQPPVGAWRIDPALGDLEQLREIPVRGLAFSEDVNDPAIRETVNQYADLWRSGKRPMPPTVVERAGTPGSYMTLNRRRVLGAERAGATSIPAWVSETDGFAPRYRHEDMIKAALERGDDVPPEVLADYPHLAPKAAPKPPDALERARAVVETPEEMGPKQAKKYASDEEMRRARQLRARADELADKAGRPTSMAAGVSSGARLKAAADAYDRAAAAAITETDTHFLTRKAKTLREQAAPTTRQQPARPDAPKASQGFAAIAAEAKARKAANYAKLPTDDGAILEDKVRGVLLTEGPGGRGGSAVISPGLPQDEGYKWRISRFDASGEPTGHSLRRSIADALRDEPGYDVAEVQLTEGLKKKPEPRALRRTHAMPSNRSPDGRARSLVKLGRGSSREEKAAFDQEALTSAAEIAAARRTIDPDFPEFDQASRWSNPDALGRVKASDPELIALDMEKRAYGLNEKGGFKPLDEIGEKTSAMRLLFPLRDPDELRQVKIPPRAAEGAGSASEFPAFDPDQHTVPRGATVAVKGHGIAVDVYTHVGDGNLEPVGNVSKNAVDTLEELRGEPVRVREQGDKMTGDLFAKKGAPKRSAIRKKKPKP